MKARYTLDPSHADVDACLRELAQTEIDQDAKVKARTVIYPHKPLEITNAHLWFFFKWSAILAGVVGLLIWGGWL